jgi:hypothetical protein
MRIGWLVNENPFRNDITHSKWFSFTNHPMRMCGFCYATQRNGSGSREKDYRTGFFEKNSENAFS